MTPIPRTPETATAAGESPTAAAFTAMASRAAT